MIATGFTSTGRGWWREGLPTETARQWRDGGNGVVAYKKRGGFGVSETGDIAGTLESEGGTHQGGPERIPLIAFDWQAGGGGNDDSFRGKSRSYIVRSGEYAQITNTHVDAVAFQPRYARNGRGAPDTVAAPLTAEAGRTGKGDSAQCVLARSTGAGWYTEDDKASIRAQSGGTTYDILAQNWGVRRLTPTECERLQGFPDGWTAEQSDSARYRQLGNAVAVPVAEWIGKQLLAAMEIDQ